MTYLSRKPGIHPVQNTSAVFISTNPVLLYGQVAMETDTNRVKTGDGVSTYTQLTYVEWNYEIVEASGTDTYTGNFSKPFFLAYFPLMRIRVRFTNSNTGASTINLNGLGAIAIRKNVSTALVAGDILAGGIYELSYDGTNFQLLTVTGNSAGVVPAPLTRVNDTNVTITLGGTPATSLLQAVSLTLGWSGELGATRGGTGQSTVTTGDLLYGSAANTWAKLAGVATGSVLASAGVGTAPSWTSSPTLTTSLTTPLINGSTSANGTLTLRSTTNGTDGDIIFQTDTTTERARILGVSGRLLINTSAELSTVGQLHVAGGGNFGGSLFYTFSSNAAHYTIFIFGRSMSDTIGTLSATGSTQIISQLQFVAINSSNAAATPASFNVVQDGAGGATFVPARFEWSLGTSAAGRTERMRLLSTGNLKLAGSAVRATTEGTNHLDIFDGTAPVGTLANGISLYSTSGELRVMDSGGTATLLSPHSKELNKIGVRYWIYDSVDTVTKTRLIIDLEKMIRAINDKFGWDFVHDINI